MKTICPGNWSAAVPAHANPPVLKDDGVPDGVVSHGVCDECMAAINKSLDAVEASRKDSKKA